MREIAAAAGKWCLCPDFAGNVVFLMDNRSRVQAKLDLFVGVIGEHLTRRLAVQFFDLGRTAVRVNSQLAGSPNGIPQDHRAYTGSVIFATADQHGLCMGECLLRVASSSSN